MAKKDTGTVKVQISLEGEDAALYEQITHKKLFVITALKLFAADEKLRIAFFKGQPLQSVALDLPNQPHVSTVQPPPNPTHHKKEW